MDVLVRSGPESPQTNKSAQTRRRSGLLMAILKNILFDSWPEIVVKNSLIRTTILRHFLIPSAHPWLAIVFLNCHHRNCLLMRNRDPGTPSPIPRTNWDEDRTWNPDKEQFPEECKNLVIKIFSGSLNIRSKSVFFAALLGEKVLCERDYL